MAVVRKYCPNCHKLIVGPVSNVHDYNYGSPIKVCPNCFHTYADEQYHEIAIDGIREEDAQLLNPIQALQLIGCLGLVALAAVFFFSASSLDELKEMVKGILSCLFFAFIFGISPVCAITGYKERKEYFKEETERSEKRLQNIEYAKKLKALGYDVPVKYLTRAEKENVNLPKAKK